MRELSEEKFSNEIYRVECHQHKHGVSDRFDSLKTLSGAVHKEKSKGLRPKASRDAAGEWYSL